MNKIIFILAAVVLGAVACNEGREEIQIDKTDFSDIQRPIVGEGGLDPNFCEGCGHSDFPADECYGNTCMQVPIGGEGCCPVTDANTMSTSLGLGIGLNSNLAYDHRDNFMILSLKGQQYISHYSEIGHFINDNDLMTSSNVIDFLNFGLEVYNKVDILRNGNNSTVIVTSAFKTQAMTFVTLIRANNPPQYLSERLDMIETDLNFFEGKTRSEVLLNL